MVKNILLLFLFSISLPARAGELSYCNEKQLLDLKTGEHLRFFSSKTECERVLARSKEGVYCDENLLLDLRTGSYLRMFSSNQACERAVGASK